MFTEDEIKKYGVKNNYHDNIYLFEPNNNIVTLNDKIEYILTVDEKFVTKNTELIVDVLYIKDGQTFKERGIGYYEKIEKNKFNIIAKFMKKGIYEIKINFDYYEIKIQVLCKHDFSIEIPYERSKYLGGEGYTDEEIELLKEKGNEKIDNIILKAPKREESSLDEFTEYLKKNTTNLNDLEKAFLLFKWITTNIDYDIEGFFNKTFKTNKYDVFKTGLTVCSGYARLFRHFADNINLITENIICFSKGLGYNEDKLNQKLDSDHEYNAVKLKNKWYLIDSTWGSGYAKNKTFIRYYNPFYFCISPDYLIYTHYPINENWQLLERPIKFKKFLSNLELHSHFFEDGFYKVEPNKFKINGIIGKNKLKVYKNNKKDIYIKILIYKLKENSSLKYNCIMINDKKYPLCSSEDKLLKKYDNILDYEYNLDEKGEYYLSFNVYDKLEKAESFTYFHIKILCT